MGPSNIKMVKNKTIMNVGILVGKSLNQFQLSVLDLIISQYRINFAIVDDKKRKTYFEKLLKHLKRGRGLYTIIMFFKKIFDKDLAVSTINYLQKKNIEFKEVNNLYNKNNLDYILGKKTDLIILISGFGIIKKSLIEIVPKGIISYHHGDMTSYRGMPPAFWELYNNENKIGVTIQRISEKLDAGEIIEQRFFEIDKKDNWKSLKKKIYNRSTDLMRIALEKINNDEKFSKPNELGKVYTLPNFRQWFFFQLKTTVRRIKK